MATYARNHGKTAVNFSSTDLVCCRTLQGHTGKVSSLGLFVVCKVGVC